jgi:cytochrome c oxidase assembly protein subunit 15
MMTAKNRQRRTGFRLALTATVLAVVVVMLGAFTRLVDAGLGCPDWPVCYGHVLWPMDADEVARANEAFPDTPVEHDKTWPEQVHRIFASSLGLFCIALAVLSLLQRRTQPHQAYPLKLSLALLVLVIVQGLFGMWTVTLKLWPQVVTAHLMGGFATLSLLALLSWRLYGSYWRTAITEKMQLATMKPIAVFVLIVVIVQVALGGWTTSNYAALACPDFPRCQTAWLPAMDFAQGFNVTQTIGPNYLGGLMDSAARTSIHFSHRVGAIVVTLATLWLAVRLIKIGYRPAGQWGKALIAILFIQVCLGISNIIFALPLFVAVAHNAVGALLLVTVTGICHRLYTVSTNDVLN